MSERIHPVPAEWAEKAWCDNDKYLEMYQRSIADPEGFWAEQAERIDWIEPWHTVKDTSFDGDVHIRWFDGAKLNLSANCLDRHLATRGEQTAIIWEGDDPEVAQHITYRDLHGRVCRFANGLKSLGVKRGDRVTIYMTMIPELAVAMLACTRIGAIHSIIFGGFSAESIAGRLDDCASEYMITADEGVRGGRAIPLKQIADDAIAKAPHVRKTVVVRRTGGDIPWHDERDVWYHDLVDAASDDCPAEAMGAEDPLFILYTSGSTGKPKGVLHTTGGYLTFVAMTHRYIFDYHDGDIYWCTADIGWITGHSYIVYGPLANGATTLMFEGVPNYPDTSRFWQVCDKHGVNIFYTAPTAIRALMREGDEPVKRTSRASIRLLGTVGEPINPEAWEWYFNVVGDRRCPIVDTWWQTETGGILITPLPGATDLKPGSATRPFFGVQPTIVDAEGNELDGACEGNLCIRDAWPGMMRSLYGDHDRFVQTYFSTYAGLYFTGDGARRDEDGYYWITGASTTSSTFPATGSAPPRSRARWSPITTSPRPPWSAIRTTSRARASTPMHADRRRRNDRGTARRIGQMGAQGDRPDRDARPDPMGARPAQDALGQDHAPHLAQDRGRRIRPARRHLDAGRPLGRRRPGRQPHEPLAINGP